VPYRADVRVDEAARAAALADDAREGLHAPPRSLPPKYFYDAAGSWLFEQITALPEYYLTRAEMRAVLMHGRAIMSAAQPDEIVELGAGGCRKIRQLLAAADGRAPSRYIPVDFDETTLARAGATLLVERPNLDIYAIIGDFERHLDAVPPARGRRLVAFFGSTIGNLGPSARARLLAAIRRLLGPEDRFLLGVDLVKDRARLEAAYNDRAGVTAAFNRNILRVLNRGLDGDFDPEAFEHLAWFDERASRIEMHLRPMRRQRVQLRRAGLALTVDSDETIWTESSYKFTRGMTAAMLQAAGMAIEEWFTDDEGLFGVVLTRAA